MEEHRKITKEYIESIIEGGGYVGGAGVLCISGECTCLKRGESKVCADPRLFLICVDNQSPPISLSTDYLMWDRDIGCVTFDPQSRTPYNQLFRQAERRVTHVENRNDPKRISDMKDVGWITIEPITMPSLSEDDKNINKSVRFLGGEGYSSSDDGGDSVSLSSSSSEEDLLELVSAVALLTEAVTKLGGYLYGKVAEAIRGNEDCDMDEIPSFYIPIDVDIDPFLKEYSTSIRGTYSPITCEWAQLLYRITRRNPGIKRSPHPTAVTHDGTKYIFSDPPSILPLLEVISKRGGFMYGSSALKYALYGEDNTYNKVRFYLPSKEMLEDFISSNPSLIIQSRLLSEHNDTVSGTLGGISFFIMTSEPMILKNPRVDTDSIRISYDGQTTLILPENLTESIRNRTASLTEKGIKRYLSMKTEEMRKVFIKSCSRGGTFTITNIPQSKPTPTPTQTLNHLKEIASRYRGAPPEYFPTDIYTILTILNSS
jgi:hypothetical protein